MLFENLNQFQAAKRTLLENSRNVPYTVEVLKNSKVFSNLSEGEIILALTELNEGLGDKITNFLSGAFGGDVNTIKTVLTQMKDQELKYNQEEFEIYNEFYALLQDQKALDRDKTNPDYQGLSNDIEQSKNGLNQRMKELNRAHGEILDALETKVKDLVKDSNRKKKYFNAQRATDVLETKNDRYDKIKAVTAKSSKRSQELEAFFGVSVQQAQQNTQQAQQNANQAVNALGNTTVPVASTSGVFDDHEEKHFEFMTTFKGISKNGKKLDEMIKELRELEKEIFDYITQGNFSPQGIQDLQNLHKRVAREINTLVAISKP